MSLQRGSGARFLAVCAAASLVVAAGCSGEDEPKAGASSEPTATVTPTETPSVVPEDETAEEFIRRWFEVGTAFQNTGDAAAFLAISERCLECRASVNSIEGFYAAGGFVDYGGEEILSIKERADTPGIFDVKFESQPTVYKKAVDSDEERLDGGVGRLVFTLERPPSGWQVRKILRR